MSSNEKNDDNKKLDEYKEKCKKEAEDLVKYIFPKKVLELNSLLHSSKFDLEQLSKLKPDLNIPIPDPSVIHNASDQMSGKKRKFEDVTDITDSLSFKVGSKVLCLPNGAVPSSSCVTEMVDIVKPQIRDVIEHANQIKMWIAYSIPRIEDGNNFGVGVQEDALAEAKQVETDAASFLDQISRYYLTRGNIIAKVAKYPHVLDFRRGVQEVDEKQALTMRLIVSELRNQYACLHDLIMKNLDKIKTPRSTNAENMY